MEYKNLIPIFKKVKPSLNFNEQYIFKRKINQRKNDINILFSNFHTEEEKKLKQLKIRFPIRKSIIKHKRISSIEFDNNINNIIDNFTERKQIKESLYDKIKFGSLEYFDYVKKKKKNSPIVKKVCSQKEYFLHSKNFDFGRTSQVNLNDYFNKTNSFFKIKDNKSNFFKKKQLSEIPISNNTLKTIENKTSTYFFISPNKKKEFLNNKEISQFSFYKNQKLKLEKKEKEKEKKEKNEETKLKNSKEKKNENLLSKTQKKILIKQNKKKINSKNKSMIYLKQEIKQTIENFDKNLKQDNKNLKTLLHKIEKKIKITTETDILKKDMDKILGLENPKKRKSDDIEIGILGKNGIVNSIDSTKAKMIKLSDRINKMTDEDAINFINGIEKEYKIESKNAGIGFLTLESGRIIDLKKSQSENKIIGLIRKQLSINSKKIKQIRFKVDQGNVRIIKKEVPLSS